MAFVDNAVWLLCARSGLYLSNDALADFVPATAAAPTDPVPTVS